MRITSSHRFFGFPSSFTLGMVLPKNFNERNGFVSHDGLKLPQAPQQKTNLHEFDLTDTKPHEAGDNCNLSEVIHETHYAHETIAEICALHFCPYKSRMGAALMLHAHVIVRHTPQGLILYPNVQSIQGAQSLNISSRSDWHGYAVSSLMDTVYWSSE
ncbi:hypothetical protein Tco_1048824 [Tanacetum coccineum]